MNPLHMILSLYLLLVPFIFIAASSSSNDNYLNNITRGSSLSTSSDDHDTASYWLSPSGNIAFGFYPLLCKLSSLNCKTVVGIWFVKSPHKTLVWTANRDHLPLSDPSLILFTNEGKFVLRMADNKDTPLIPDVHESVSYALMKDDGNFVLYGADSKILWQSVDHPTDTILIGQRLNAGVDLVSSVSSLNHGSGKYRLSVNQNNGLVAIHKFRHLGINEKASSFVVSEAFPDSISKPITLNLEIGGNLYLIGSDNVVLRVFYESKQQYEDENAGKKVYIYRATLNPKGLFNVYKERIDGMGDEKSAVVRLWSSYHFWDAGNITKYSMIGVIITLCVCGPLIIYIKEARKRKVVRIGIDEDEVL